MAKILIVDDDSAVQLTVLERADHGLVAASDGRKGMALFDEGDFDLLFPDIFMPGMDGFETMRLVRQQMPLKPPTIGRRGRRQCCFRPVMRTSIGCSVKSRSKAPVLGEGRKRQHDTRYQTRRRHDCAGCDRDQRGRMAELSQR